MGINFNRHMILIDALMRILCQWRHPFAELLFQIICLHNSFVQMYFICIGRICIFLFCISINNRLALDFNPSDLFSHKMYTHTESDSLYIHFFFQTNSLWLACEPNIKRSITSELRWNKNQKTCTFKLATNQLFEDSRFASCSKFGRKNCNQLKKNGYGTIFAAGDGIEEYMRLFAITIIIIIWFRLNNRAVSKVFLPGPRPQIISLLNLPAHSYNKWS